MFTSQSVEEIEKDIDKIKSKVLAFNGTKSSKRYVKLQKKISEADKKLSHTKQSSAPLVQGVCDQLSKQLNECLKILTDKVTNKDGDECEDRELEEERDFRKHRRKNDAKLIISNIEKEMPSVEYKIENITETKDSGRKDSLKSELNKYSKELALANTERETSLDDRKNKIMERLANCYKQLINMEEGFKGSTQFENQSNGNPLTGEEFMVINELIQRRKRLYQENSYSISTASEQESLSTSSYISDVDNLVPEIVVNSNHFNNSNSWPAQTLHHKAEKRPPSLPPRPPNDSDKSSETNIWQDIKPVTLRFNKTPPPIPSKHHKDKERPSSFFPKPPNDSGESSETNFRQDVKAVTQNINKTPPLIPPKHHKDIKRPPSLPPRPPKDSDESSETNIRQDVKPVTQKINKTPPPIPSNHHKNKERPLFFFSKTFKRFR